MTALAASEAYRRWAPSYEQENALTTLEREVVERLSPSPEGLRLLDVGCGTGRRLVGTGARRAVGVEPCEEMLAAGSEAHAFGPEVALLSGDARALPLPDGRFDLVWCRLVIGHLPDCAAAYRELARVAAKGGRVVVTDFHPAASAAGFKRTFRDGNDVLEVEHHLHSLDAHIAAASASGLRFLASEEGAVGPSVRSYYEAAGRGAAYSGQRGFPMVLGLSFVRDG